MVGYSGGKCMRGPQAAGVLLGPRDLCQAAFWNAAPHHNWGRALKVGKEEAMGMLAAVRLWYKRDHQAEQAHWLAWDQQIAGKLKDIPSLTTAIEMPTADLSNRAPVLSIRWDASIVGITGSELVMKLDQGTPRILVLGGEGKRPDHMDSAISIMPYMMQPGDAAVIAEVLSKTLRNPGHFANPPVPAGKTAEIAGTWKATIHYTRGTGEQQFTLRQTGSTLEGELRGEVFNTVLRGSVEGDQVTLTGVMAGNANEIPYRFTGIVLDGTLSGDVDMGEYGQAAFTATRA